MILFGLAGMAAGSVILPMMPTRIGALGYITPLVVITAGYALFQAANKTAVMLDLPAEQGGVVSGLLNLSRNLGLITGACVMGTVFALGASATGLALSSAADDVSGMRATFAVAAVLSFAALAIATVGRGASRRTLVADPERGGSRGV